MAGFPFPGRVIQVGEADEPLVTALQAALAARGLGPFDAGVFDAGMEAVVKLFQAQNVDASGRPLVVDGEVGLYTWGALFPDQPQVPAAAPSTLMLQALAVAGTQERQMEVPPGSNRGPMVDHYLASVGIDPLTTTADQRYWCAAFVYYCFQTAATSLGRGNPLPRTGGCIDHWKRAATVPRCVRVTAADAYATPALVKPGLVFILDFGGNHGHTGLVEKLLPGGILSTIEGNTDATGSGNGVGVFRLTRRKLNDKTLLGFIDYSAC